MQVISNINPELKSILEEYSTWFFSNDYNNELNPTEKKNDNKKGDYATSNEYLKEALKDPKAFGFPRHMLGAIMENRVKPEELQLKKYRAKCDEIDNKLINYFSARNNALRAYYPVGGYIGWHHNGNAPGYNIVITCNPEGDGEFVHYNHNTNTIIKYPDKKGWFVKVGYFGSFQESEKMYWHCARTRSPRLTLSYIIPHLNLWQAMIDDIGIPDTNPETIDSIL